MRGGRGLMVLHFHCNRALTIHPYGGRQSKTQHCLSVLLALYKLLLEKARCFTCLLDGGTMSSKRGTNLGNVSQSIGGMISRCRGASGYGSPSCGG